jgi:chitinase
MSKDWEYPGDPSQGADRASQENFNLLVNEYRDAVEEEAKLTDNKKLIISAAVSPDPKKINAGYYVENLCAKLDYISVMTYDYHGHWDLVTGLNSPLYTRDDSSKPNDIWKNSNYSIYYWIKNGCEKEKINLGIAAYGELLFLKTIF